MAPRGQHIQLTIAVRFRWQPRASPSGPASCSAAQAVSTLHVGGLRNLAFGAAGGGAVSEAYREGEGRGSERETAQRKDGRGRAPDSRRLFGKLAWTVPPSMPSALPTGAPTNSPSWLLMSLAQLAGPRPGTVASEETFRVSPGTVRQARDLKTRVSKPPRES